MSRLTRSPHGLDVDHREHWSTQAACRSMDPASFEKDTGKVTLQNREALTACWLDCPVRRQCLEACTSVPQVQRPRGLIQGGWLWDEQGRGTSGLQHVPKVEPKPEHGYGHNGPPAVAAAREWLAGHVTMRAVARKHNVTATYVQQAAALVRHHPDLASKVAKGELSLSGAYLEARRLKLATL